jgi:hypothetical protein
LAAPAIEDKYCLDMIIIEYLIHLQDKVEIFDGLLLMLHLKVVAIATPVDPRHHVHGQALALEARDMLLPRNRLQELEQAINSHLFVGGLNII